MKSQKEAVYAAITATLAEAGIAFEDGQNVAQHMTKELRGQVNAILVEGFKSGGIKVDREFTESDLKTYVSGLQSNWIRKDKRLNGSVKYVAKNPGSRAGSGDESLKAMRQLLKTLTPGSADFTEVERHIGARIAELGATKQKVAVNFEALPEALRSKFSN